MQTDVHYFKKSALCRQNVDLKLVFKPRYFKVDVWNIWFQLIFFNIGKEVSSVSSNLMIMLCFIISTIVHYNNADFRMYKYYSFLSVLVICILFKIDIMYCCIIIKMSSIKMINAYFLDNLLTVLILYQCLFNIYKRIMYKIFYYLQLYT